VVFATVAALAGISAGRANAGAVYLWVADGTAVTGYQSSGGTLSSVVTLTAPTGGWGDAFSVATYGPNASDQFVVVSDAGKHTLTEYSYNASAGTNGTASGPSQPFAFPADPAGGSISPQQIAIDSSGNLWTTSAGGNVSEWCGATGGCTFNGSSKASGSLLQTVQIPTADGAPRGIMINGSTVYVTTSTYGASGAGVYDFTYNSSGHGSLTTYYALTANTTSGGNETGQLRGITYDPGGNIFFDDSTWGASGSAQGYVLENAGTATNLTALNGPNGLETGYGTSSTSDLSSSCDVLFVGSYYSGNLGESNTGYNTSGVLNSTCEGSGVFKSSQVVISGLTNLSGVALAIGNGGLGDDAGSIQGLFEPNTPAIPEPGTLALMIGALLLAIVIGIRVQRRRLQSLH
jgi:hypothetical protein